MNRAKITIVVYLVADLLVFAFGYYIVQIREMGLYLFLIAVGLPSSCAVVPLSEQAASHLGWALGSTPHVWLCAVVSAFLNVGIAAAIVVAWRSMPGRKRRVV